MQNGKGSKMDRRKKFSQRLSELRIGKGVSSRDMSLSLGLSPAYINNIENNVSMPSMDAFFLICDYLEISPRDFFDFEQKPPVALLELYVKESCLTPRQINLISELVDEMLKKRAECAE